MSILDDLVRAHAARARMTSNPDQFAARGEPWQMSREERVEISTKTSRKIRKAQALKPKTNREKIFRENPRAYPAPSEAVLASQRERELLRIGLTAGTGNPNSRTLAPSTRDERDYFLRIHTKLDTIGAAPRLKPIEDKDPWGDVCPEALARKAKARAEWLAKERADILARYNR